KRVQNVNILQDRRRGGVTVHFVSSCGSKSSEMSPPRRDSRRKPKKPKAKGKINWILPSFLTVLKHFGKRKAKSGDKSDHLLPSRE
ncbi:MAG: hypothetical protein WCL54_03250, partial [Clostridia bacterium]